MEEKDIYMGTYTGIFHPMSPKIEEINLTDIAHALSLICRFGGQCKYFYSVAQHCINVYRDLEALGYDEEIQLRGLLHDASEAYLADMITPIKKQLTQYKEIEKRVEQTILRKFELTLPTDDIYKIIKDSDKEIFYHETRFLMSKYYDELPKRKLRNVQIDTYFRSMIDVENEYLDTANKLIKKRQNKSIQK